MRDHKNKVRFGDQSNKSSLQQTQKKNLSQEKELNALK